MRHIALCSPRAASIETLEYLDFHRNHRQHLAHGPRHDRCFVLHFDLPLIDSTNRLTFCHSKYQNDERSNLELRKKTLLLTPQTMNEACLQAPMTTHWQHFDSSAKNHSKVPMHSSSSFWKVFNMPENIEVMTNFKWYHNSFMRTHVIWMDIDFIMVLMELCKRIIFFRFFHYFCPIKTSTTNEQQIPKFRFSLFA